MLVLLVLMAWVLPAPARHAAIDPTSYLWRQVHEPKYHVNDVWRAHKPTPERDEVIKLAGDTLPYLPREYDPTLRNPCWDRGGAFVCLPYFQVLGVSKCGTTDYYHRLTFHPEMIDCGWKGPHFWDESGYPVRSRPGGRYNGSFQAYVEIFNKAAARIRADQGRRAITGEASSNTFSAVLSHLRGHRHMSRGARPGLARRATLAHYLWEATPWARYIILFRDPVTRYFSAFHYYRTKRDGMGSPQQVHERATMDITHWEACVRKDGKQACLVGYEPQQLVKGMYAEHLPAWLDVWPRDRLLIMRNEDYQAAPRPHLQAGMIFLGLRNLTDQEWPRLVGMRKKNTQASKYGSGMLPETIKLLQDFYRPFNQRLAELMGGDPRWLWGY